MKVKRERRSDQKRMWEKQTRQPKENRPENKGETLHFSHYHRSLGLLSIDSDACLEGKPVDEVPARST